MSIFDKIGKVRPGMPLVDDPVPAIAENEAPKKTDARIKGRILSLNTKRGFGFLQSDALPFTRIYFHWTFLVQGTKKFNELERGMEVEFTMAKGTDSKGVETDRAIKIKVL